MSRSWRYREDQPGDVQYVTVKGVGGLPIFGFRADVRFFLSLIAREVRAGALAVFCYSFVRNHAHFLVLSPHGEIFRPMKRALENFARYYNRRHGRVGHVFKDRFHSSRVHSESYFICCVIYTDYNPVKAGLVGLPTEYEFGSAYHYVRPRAPMWLDRSRVSAYVRGADAETGQAPERPYLHTFEKGDYELIERLIERRSFEEKGEDDPFDVFLSPDRQGRIDWLLQQAKQADGTTGGRLLAKVDVLKDLIEVRAGRNDWNRRRSVASPVPWKTLLVGLLRLGSGLSCREVERILGVSSATVSRETGRHRDLLAADPGYLAIAEEVLTEALRQSFSFLLPFARVAPDGSTRMKHL